MMHRQTNLKHGVYLRLAMSERMDPLRHHPSKSTGFRDISLNSGEFREQESRK